MQRGYLNQKAHEPARALADFRAAEATGKAPAWCLTRPTPARPTAIIHRR
jgi:hypothetical protein